MTVPLTSVQMAKKVARLASLATSEVQASEIRALLKQLQELPSSSISVDEALEVARTLMNVGGTLRATNPELANMGFETLRNMLDRERINRTR